MKLAGLLILLLLGISGIAATVGGAAERAATPASLASVYADAAAGDTITLAAGNYGSWQGGSKAIVLKPEAGATVSMSVSLPTSARNLTFDGVRVTGGTVRGQGIKFANVDFGTNQIVVRDGASGVEFDRTTWGAYNAGGSYEGRLSVIQGAATPSATPTASPTVTPYVPACAPSCDATIQGLRERIADAIQALT